MGRLVVDVEMHQKMDVIEYGDILELYDRGSWKVRHHSPWEAFARLIVEPAKQCIFTTNLECRSCIFVCT